MLALAFAACFCSVNRKTQETQERKSENFRINICKDGVVRRKNCRSCENISSVIRQEQCGF